jgi:hypothetical protein
LVDAIAKQIRASAQAFPLFDLAKLFLSKPERHRVRIKAAHGTTLYQAGKDGPISPDKSLLARAAFASLKSQFYREETVEGEEIRGNFASVARCRATGTLLGPTNLHTYQPSLRRHYQKHFANRMPYEAFLRQVEVISDPEAVEKWKAASRTKTVFRSLDESAPAQFESPEEAERHFLQHHLPALLQQGETFDAPGAIASSEADPATASAIRAAWEHAIRHPLPMMDALRPLLLGAGLHQFRRSNKNQMFTAIRPRAFTADRQSLSDGVRSILDAVADQPGISRAALAERLLGAGLAEEELAAKRNALAADLLWLAHAGHLIQYADGALELARPPAKQEPAEKKPKIRPEATAATSVPPAEELPETAEAADVAAGIPPHEESETETAAGPAADGSLPEAPPASEPEPAVTSPE